MGREHSNSKHVHQRSNSENDAVIKADQPIEPDDAAEAQSRQRVIGKELRRWYDTIVKEPVPDELLDLLAKIDQKEG